MPCPDGKRKAVIVPVMGTRTDWRADRRKLRKIFKNQHLSHIILKFAHSATYYFNIGLKSDHSHLEHETDICNT
jgi:hypothetical protein